MSHIRISASAPHEIVCKSPFGDPRPFRPSAPFLELRAELVYKFHTSGNDAPAPLWTNSFTCTVGSNEWWIETDAAKRAIEKWHFDGTNVCSSVRIVRPMPEEQRARFTQFTRLSTVPFEAARSNLTVRVWESGHGHPLADLHINMVWLAFCSGPHLKREGRLIPLPCDNLHHAPDRYAYRDKTETFDDGVGLPRVVDLYLSKALYETSATDFYREWFTSAQYVPWTKKVVAKLTEGFHQFHYAVLATTNFAGRTFPQEFEFRQEGRPWQQNGDWIHQGTGTLKSIRATERPEGPFDTSMQQSVVDWRFRDEAAGIDGIIYTSTNNFVAPTNDPQLQEIFRERISESRNRKKSNFAP